jgi:hypothetical protein
MGDRLRQGQTAHTSAAENQRGGEEPDSNGGPARGAQAKREVNSAPTPGSAAKWRPQRERALKDGEPTEADRGGYRRAPLERSYRDSGNMKRRELRWRGLRVGHLR